MKLQIDPMVGRALAGRLARRGARIDADLSRPAAAAQPRTWPRGRGGGPRGGCRAGHHRHRRRPRPRRARRRRRSCGSPGRRRGQMLAARPGAGHGDRRAWAPPRSPGRSGSPPPPASGSWPRAASAGSIAAAKAASTSRPTCTSSPAPGSPSSAAAPRSSSTCRARWRCWRPWPCRWSGYRCTELPGLLCPRQRAAGARSSTMFDAARRTGPHPGRARLALRHRGRQSAAGRAGAAPGRSSSSWIAQATAEAQAQGIGGKDTTPFLLAALARLSGGRTVTLNEALVLDNARLAARLARALRPD